MYTDLCVGRTVVGCLGFLLLLLCSRSFTDSFGFNEFTHAGGCPARWHGFTESTVMRTEMPSVDVENLLSVTNFYGESINFGSFKSLNVSEGLYTFVFSLSSLKDLLY